MSPNRPGHRSSAGVDGAQIPPRAGVGFKPQHAPAILADPQGVQWFEVHAENYMVGGGPRLRLLEQLRADFPVSLHGVGLSLGGGSAPARDHLVALRDLADRIEPGLISEHVAWSSHDGRYLADLLPLPYCKSALTCLVEAISATQDALRRRILIENPSSYLTLPGGTMPESEFLAAAARASGCGLLVDVNNVYVSAQNLGLDANEYVDALPVDLIGEIHLAGHALEFVAGEAILIDSHGAAVAPAVWELYARLVARSGPRPTLIERDTEVPPWSALAAEAGRAEHVAACAHASGRDTS